MIYEAKRRFDVPAETLWTLFAEQFGDVANWISLLDESGIEGPDKTMREGAVRYCTDTKGATIKEVAQVYDPAQMILEYAITEGAPAWAGRASNRWTFRNLPDGRSEAHSRVTMPLPRFLWPFTPLMRLYLNRIYRTVFRDIDHKLASTPSAYPLS